MKRILMLLLLAIVALCALGGWWWHPNTTVVRLSNRFFDCLQKGDVAGAHALLADESQKLNEPAELEALADELGIIGHRGVTWEEIDVDEDYGKTAGTVETRDGTDLSIEVISLKRDGKWAIHIVREPSTSEPETD